MDPNCITGKYLLHYLYDSTRMVLRFRAPVQSQYRRVGGQIESLSWNTAGGFGSALNAFMGQNYGARKVDRIKQGYAFPFGFWCAGQL